MQDTAFIRSLDILFRDIATHIEAALHHAGITLLTEYLAFLVLVVLLQGFLRRDGQITVVQFQMNFILLEAGQINIYLIALIRFPDVRLHHVLRVFAVQSMIDIAEATEKITVEIIKNVHQVFTENSRKISAHHADLQSLALHRW